MRALWAAFLDRQHGWQFPAAPRRECICIAGVCALLILPRMIAGVSESTAIGSYREYFPLLMIMYDVFRTVQLISSSGELLPVQAAGSRGLFC